MQSAKIVSLFGSAQPDFVPRTLPRKGNVDDSTQSTTTQPQKPPLSIRIQSLLETTARQWKLQGLYLALHSKLYTRSRIPIIHSHRAALLGCAMHLPALGGIAALSYFMFQEIFIGKELSGPQDQDTEKLLALQFAAKLMELLIVMSLTSIVFTMVRWEMTLGEGVPLAAFVAGFQISDVTFLWSKEMFAILRGRYASIWRKALFVATIVLFTVLSIAVAPASATAMIPKDGKWRAGGSTIWWNASEAAIFPDNLNETHTLGPTCGTAGNPLCPSWQWDAINALLVSKLPGSSRIVDRVMGPRPPRNIIVSGRSTLLEIVTDVREPVYDAMSPNYTVVAMPHFATSDALVYSGVHWDRAAFEAYQKQESRVWLYKSTDFHIHVRSALTHTRCHMSLVNRTSDADPPIFPDLKFKDFRPTHLDESVIKDWQAKHVANMTRPEIFWFDLDHITAANGSIGAVVALPTNRSASLVQLYGCMVDARWATATLASNRITLVTQGAPPGTGPRDTSGEGTWLFNQAYGWRVHIRPSFAQYVNPVVSARGRNSTVFEEMALASELWKPGVGGSGSEPHLEAIIGLMLTNGMARSAPYTTPVLKLKSTQGDWWKEFLPRHGKKFGPGGTAYKVPTEDQEMFLWKEMEAWVTGYAYTQGDSTTVGALGILMFYALIVSVYMGWSLFSGFTSSSWETVSDLLALAMKSPSPDDSQLSGISAGFSSMKGLQQTYSIQVEGSHLRLGAVNGEVPDEKRVKANVAYD
ncbi:hypothetical protein ACJ41O_003794 [Fusarium nematophilum]